ncbi:hypothetical protein APHAL10511_003520 [Amanita phalloides]|nr:hypothetical protein APHAL10511_003520 [Amanita phalloides]
MTRYFDKTTKPNYKGTSRAVYIKFGRRESNPEFGIIAGGVKVDGTQIARFFKPAITSIIKAVEDQIRNSSIPIKAIFMAGGFATSDYLFSQLDEHFKEKGINILRPDAYLNKAVAEGAVLFKVDRAVTTRVAKYTYGVEMSCPYDQQNRAHRSRRKKCFSGPSGERFMPNVFSVILEKVSFLPQPASLRVNICRRQGTEVSEEGEFRKSYINEYSEFEFKALNIETMMIKCYRGREGGSAPAWIDDSRLFPDLCMITADLHDLKKTIEPQFRGKTIRTKFYEVEFDVILFFGLTELKAQIAWMQYVSRDIPVFREKENKEPSLMPCND